MNKAEELRQWFIIADADLQLAEDTSTKTYPVHEAQVCYHCQQSAEKYLKGFLRFSDIKIEKIHDLRKLQGQCQTKDESFSALTNQCAELNKDGSIPRYPVEWTLTETDVRRAIKSAKDVHNFVQNVLKNKGYIPVRENAEVITTIETLASDKQNDKMDEPQEGTD
jgi:HEPN domain-containing protein